MNVNADADADAADAPEDARAAPETGAGGRLLIVALPQELAAIVKASPRPVRGKLRRLYASTGVVRLDLPTSPATRTAASPRHTYRVALTVGRTGMGAAAVERVVPALLADAPASAVFLGFGGALDPALAPGALVLAREVVTERGVSFTPAPAALAWLEHATQRAELAAESGRLLSVPAPIGTPTDKARAHAATGAVIADCESGAFATACAATGVPWAVARVVIDDARTRLDPRLTTLAEATGRRLAARLMALTLAAPWLWLALPRLAKKSARAGRVLGALTRALIADPAFGGESRRRAGCPPPGDVICEDNASI